jgi:hypothetical protein
MAFAMVWNGLPLTRQHFEFHTSFAKPPRQRDRISTYLCYANDEQNRRHVHVTCRNKEHLHKQERRCTMRRLGTAIRLVFYLPALWILLAVIAFVVAVNSSGPLADILVFAIQRLFFQ